MVMKSEKLQIILTLIQSCVGKILIVKQEGIINIFTMSVFESVDERRLVSQNLWIKNSIAKINGYSWNYWHVDALQLHEWYVLSTVSVVITKS